MTSMMRTDLDLLRESRMKRSLPETASGSWAMMNWRWMKMQNWAARDDGKHYE